MDNQTKKKQPKKNMKKPQVTPTSTPSRPSSQSTGQAVAKKKKKKPKKLTKRKIAQNAAIELGRKAQKTLCPEQQTALHHMLNSPANVFITGPPGSGKTALICTFAALCPEADIYAPLKNVAAHIASCGVPLKLTQKPATIYSAFGLEKFEKAPSFYIDKIKTDKTLLAKIRRATIIVTDECCWLEESFQKKLDTVLSAVRHNNALFGGIRFRGVFDHFQMGPPKNWHEFKHFWQYPPIYRDLTNPTPNSKNIFIQLKNIHRQQDKEYAEAFALLNGQGAPESDHKVVTVWNKLYDRELMKVIIMIIDGHGNLDKKKTNEMVHTQVLFGNKSASNAYNEAMATFTASDPSKKTTKFFAYDMATTKPTTKVKHHGSPKKVTLTHKQALECNDGCTAAKCSQWTVGDPVVVEVEHTAISVATGQPVRVPARSRGRIVKCYSATFSPRTFPTAVVDFDALGKLIVPSNVRHRVTTPRECAYYVTRAALPLKLNFSDNLHRVRNIYFSNFFLYSTFT